MKSNKTFLILIIAVITAVLLCSCSRSSMRSAGDAMRNTTRRAENFLDNGVNAVENGLENGVGRGAYGANNNYSGNTATGTNTVLPRDGKASPLLPTIRERRNDNIGKINTNKGSLDGGLR